jgi:polyphosphate kinase 2 (PPK2 family)
MYAHNRYGVLICLGMDTSGRDSLIREVLKTLIPGVVAQF